MAKGVKTGERTKGTPNKATAEVRAYAQQYSETAIEALVTIMEVGESEAARVSAANAILDRAHGKPATTFGDGDGNNVNLAETLTSCRKRVEGYTVMFR